jgi:hypothetical protein
MFDALTEEPYRFPYYMLAWTLTAALMGLVLFPWAIVAYKIRHGNAPIDEDIRDELLRRSFYAGWSIAGASVVFVFLDFLLTDDAWFALPAGVMHIVLLLGFLALAAWWMMYFFSLEDFFQGLMLTVLYLYIPTAIMFVTFGHKWNLLYIFILGWMKDPKV